MKLKSLILSVILFSFFSVSAFSADRIVPKVPKIIKVKVKFNGEFIITEYVFLDFRTAEEKKRDEVNGKLAGDSFFFFHGHAQRATDGYWFSSDLAYKSKSGIVFVATSDTPYGVDKKLRGDSGKMVILMELARYVFNQHNLKIDGYKSISKYKVYIKGKAIPEKFEKPATISTKLISLGYSHGGILSRRFAYTYQDSVEGLAQVCPTGYERWGVENGCTGPTALLTNFTGEMIKIGAGVFRGEGKYINNAGCGIAKGMISDTFRSCGACIGGNVTEEKFFRPWKDIRDCTTYLDDTNAALPKIKYIVVNFGQRDSVFEWRHMGIKDYKHVTEKERETFWSRFYPSSVVNGAKLTVNILPGNHLAPLVYHDKYSDKVLLGTNQYREDLLAKKKKLKEEKLKEEKSK